ncbi:TetR family transcriptional regulator [Microbacterium sp. X-17]|uniref:TetR/AcrR family transcriptional regulator n=1 Tax=Microbacterium sp. X-17 TaxID=3144404 RepID=UPI0031F5A7C6
MPDYVLPKAPRRRGRPRGGASDARARILEAAAHEFSEHGYDAATMRGIAARAGVDAALLHHYFGGKSELFMEVVDFPIRPDRDLPSILDGPRDEVGERVVRYILETWERPEVRRRGIAVLRAAIGNRLTTPLLAEFLARELLPRIAGTVEGEDSALRAALAGSQIAGLLLGRYVLRVRPLVEASVDELVTRVGATIQAYLGA